MPVHRTPALRAFARPARRTPLALALLCTTWAALCLPGNGRAVGSTPLGGRNPDPYTVRDIVIDSQATNAALAREAGIRNGQRDAWVALLRRLTLDGAAAALAAIGNDHPEALTESFEVQEERILPARYLGTMTVRFSPAAVRARLAATQTPFSDATSRPIVVLPVEKRAGGAILWQERTPWRQQWLQAADAWNGLAPLAVPTGEKEDAALIDAEAALNGHVGALARIAHRHGARLALVAVLEGEPGQPRQASAILYDPAKGESRSLGTLDASGIDPLSSGSYAALVESWQHTLEEEWTAATLVQPGAQDGIVLRITFERQQEWQSMRRRLERIALGNAVTIESLSRNEARIALRYAGDLARLRLLLEQSDLALEAQASGGWQLRTIAVDVTGMDVAVP
jgi:Uncharacterized protein conserved in bacteria (DUF2066)